MTVGEIVEIMGPDEHMAEPLIRSPVSIFGEDSDDARDLPPFSTQNRPFNARYMTKAEFIARFPPSKPADADTSH